MGCTGSRPKKAPGREVRPLSVVEATKAGQDSRTSGELVSASTGAPTTPQSEPSSLWRTTNITWRSPHVPPSGRHCYHHYREPHINPSIKRYTHHPFSTTYQGSSGHRRHSSRTRSSCHRKHEHVERSLSTGWQDNFLTRRMQTR
ncbi:hypothetical protein Pmar_PMAR016573 [Perkinsus marinus ATCC 50983]|uniref:Uncharacterized protein n=1 Tax=Perkinsus marinus (strain ATCC 50983 / TXsc) TaxID=423536 RepID=C5KTJ3_PERM5|nr:hypothetical protein Pmar_PMAR016573 [Perkinsus marinus ATCC 50983]EER12172.1 hypothetical protein Pmar_PMAR016573 [Perkinsus marinus ATCC 50983]|eukprot:XP_002780377.1 hypothetical protein Pmar_PMAR016573 [Perkinsus marinus ATCC 50983]